MKTAKLYFNKNNNKFSIIKLKDLCTFTTGKLDVNAENPKGKYKFFTCAREDKYIDYYAFNGLAILIAGNGDVGHTKLYNGKFNAYQRTYVLQNFKGDAQYIKQQIDFNLPKKVQEELQGGAMPYIKLETLSNLNIHLPNLEEQQKISTFLSAFDLKIDHESQIIEQLKQLKKSLLYKMFPTENSNIPELRFKGFTETWEQRKLGDVATFINGRAYSQPELLSSGKYKVLRVGNFYTNDSWYYSDLELGEKYYADYGDLLYTWSATFGPHIWLGDRVIYHYHIWKIDLSNQFEKQFAVQLLEQDKANILSSKNGSTMVHITKEGMEQKDVIIPPSTKEQQEIGAFFQQLDNLITLHQRKYDKLVQVKKALLSKMFV